MGSPESEPIVPEREPVLPDRFYRVNIADWEKVGAPDHVMVSPKFDRIDHYTRYGQFVLKVYDDEYGLMSLFVDETTAARIQAYANLPLVERDQIFQSEYETYIESQQKSIDDSWLD